MSERVEPFAIVHPVFEHDWSKYPDKVRVAMPDGKVVDYRIDVPMPAPVFKEKLDRFTEMCVGYKYKRRKRRWITRTLSE